MKLQEIKDKTIEELKEAILSAKKELFQLKIKQINLHSQKAE